MILLVFWQPEGEWKLINNRTYKTLDGAKTFGIGMPATLKILESGVGSFNGIDASFWILGRGGSKIQYKIIDVEDFAGSTLAQI